MKPIGAPKANKSVSSNEPDKNETVSISDDMKAKLKCLENPYQMVFKTKITHKTDDYIILDETYFYPQGGGQPGDTGYINDVKIINTKKLKDTIIHEYEGENNLSIGDKVNCKIDWEKRNITMRAHSAAHIMEYFLFKKFGEMEVVGNFLSEGKDKSTYETKIEITTDKLKSIEHYENIPDMIDAGWVLD